MEKKKGGSETKLKIGDKAPDFTLADTNGKKVSLKDFRGKKVALYFYPKDDTPGCTAEACSVRDNFSKLEKEGIVVIGVSIDEQESHKKFAQKYNLPHILLCDTEKEVVQKYGVWGLKNMYGKMYWGTNRLTFLIDEEGKIVHIFEKVDTKEHAREILEAFESLELEEETDQDY